MPLRSYICPSHHETDTLITGAYPEWIVCAECGATARYTIGAPARGIVLGSKNPIRETASSRDGFTVLHETETFVLREKGKSLTRVDYECFVCRARFGDDYDIVPETHPLCVECGASTHPIIVGVADVDWFTKDHPHGWYDPGLGCFVANRAEWKAEMARQGVVECDWTQGVQDQARADAVRAAEEDEEVRRMLHDYKHGPDAEAMARHAETSGLDWRVWADELGVK